MKPARFLVILLSIGVLFMVTNITPKMGGSPFASAENAVANLEGWTELSATFTYTSADDPSFVLGTSDGDLYYLSPGWRVRLKQGGGYKYFIITRVTYGGGSTSLTLYGGIDYDLENLEITHFAISNVKAPSGFPLDPAKWTVLMVDATTRTSTTFASWTQADASHKVDLPPGIWFVSYSVYVNENGVSSSQNINVSLSTSSSAPSDVTYQRGIQTAVTVQISGVSLEMTPQVIGLSSETTYYLIFSVAGTATNWQTAFTSYQPTVIRAVCAYL